jgi:CRISPR-associated protein Csb2
VPIASGTERDATVEALLVWVPAGLTTDEVARVIAVRRVSGRRGGGEDAYEIKGFPDADLLLQAVGPVATLAPELCGPARVWRSLTPYLPVRHRKRETLDEFVAKDVRMELGYRGVETEVVVSRLSQDEGLSDRWALGFRRYRTREHLGQARRGLGVRLEFAEPVPGPLLLGQLSHFGHGIFTPEEPT